jgi:GH25 family lysozyme M1 (1,4-beta-N-acetylmuramidase)
MVRLGFRGWGSEGNIHADEYGMANLIGAQDAGLQVGVYFFSQAINEEEALEEARYLCRLLEGKDPDLPVFYDWEYLEGRVPKVWELSVADLAVSFCEEVRRKGYEPGVYFNRDYGDNYLELDKLQDYVIWLAEYSDVPKASYHFHCLQYTDQGSVPGIQGCVDLDLLILEGSASSSKEGT